MQMQSHKEMLQRITVQQYDIQQFFSQLYRPISRGGRCVDVAVLDRRSNRDLPFLFHFIFKYKLITVVAC